MKELTLLAVMFVLLVASSFFSLAEMSIVGTSKIRLRHFVSQKVKGAQALQDLVSNIDRTITAIVLADNFMDTGISVLGTALCISLLGQDWGLPAATFVMGTVILVVGDITPKVFAVRYAERVALVVAPFMRLLMFVLGPVANLFSGFSNRVLKALGVPARPHSPLITEEELKLMIEMGRREGVFGEHERTLLHRIFEFGELKVKDVMVPLAQVVSAPETAAHEEILRLLTEEGHSRIPIYKGSRDRILGVIYAQSLLHIWQQGSLIVLQDLLQPVHRVSPESKVADLLQEFQRRRIQIAVVEDAKGSALGLVTLEDLVEEIVGDIQPESLESEPLA